MNTIGSPISLYIAGGVAIATTFFSLGAIYNDYYKKISPPAIANEGTGLQGRINLQPQKKPEPATATKPQLSNFLQELLNSSLYTAIKDGNIATVVSLLEEGADSNATYGETGRPFLMIPLFPEQRNSEELVRILIHKGADPNKQTTRSQYTPLMVAATNGHNVAARTLLEMGADPEIRNRNGESAADIALQKGNAGFAAVLQSFHQEQQRKILDTVPLSQDVTQHIVMDYLRS